MGTATRTYRRASRKAYIEALRELSPPPHQRQAHVKRALHFSRVSLETISCAIVSFETRFLILTCAMWVWVVVDICFIVTGEWKREQA